MFNFKRKNMAADFFPWEDKYSVNSDILDEQHKKLFKLVNELYDAFTTGGHKEILGDIIENLHAYTIYHFTEEEKLIQRCGSKLHPDHLLEHDDFIKKIAEEKQKFAISKDSVTYGLMRFLGNWLTEHIMDTDQQYVEVLVRNQQNIKY